MTADNANPFASPRAVDEPTALPTTTSQWSADDVRRLRNVGGGLRMIYFSIYGALGVIIFLTLLGLEVFGEIDWFMAFVGLTVAAGFALYVLGMIGVGLCLYAPKASRARPFAFATLTLQAAALLINLIIGALADAASAGFLPRQVFLNLVVVASAASLLIFAWRMADFLARDDSARRARRTLLAVVFSYGLLFSAGFTATWLLPSPETPTPPAWATIVTAGAVVAGGIGCLAAFLMFANTITYLRRAIGEAINTA